MPKFNLMELLTPQTEPEEQPDGERAESPQRKPTFQIIALSVFDLIPSEDNFYSMEEIEKLKRDIELAGGVKQNLTVTPLEDGKYKVLAGHRRRLASIQLVKEGNPQYEFVPCGIEPEQTDKELQAIREELLIITTNSQRNKTDWDKVQEAQRLRDILKRYKKHGGKLPGGVREIVADTLNTSDGQVGRLDAIAKNLAPEFKEEMREKRLGISAAYELSRLPEDRQKELYADYQVKGGLSVNDVKPPAEPKEPKKAETPPPAPQPAAEPAPPPSPPRTAAPPEPTQASEIQRPSASRPEETRCIDSGLCPYCKKHFDAAKAVNYKITGTQGSGPVQCPHCGGAINIFCSVEYRCSAPEGGEAE